MVAGKARPFFHNFFTIFQTFFEEMGFHFLEKCSKNCQKMVNKWSGFSGEHFFHHFLTMYFGRRFSGDHFFTIFSPYKNGPSEKCKNHFCIKKCPMKIPYGKMPYEMFLYNGPVGHKGNVSP